MARGRVSTPLADGRVSISVPQQLADRLDALAAPAGITRSQVARALLAAALPPMPTDHPTATEEPECPAP